MDAAVKLDEQCVGKKKKIGMISLAIRADSPGKVNKQSFDLHLLAPENFSFGGESSPDRH